MVEARDFDSVEVGEINTYIQANIPYTILQTTFPLTETLYNKAQVYTIIYRIINGAKNYVETATTKDKLINLLKENEEIYNSIYSLLLAHENSKLKFGQHLIIHRLRKMFENIETNIKINRLIDIFLVFGEKLTLLNTDRVVGVELDSKEGQDMYKKIIARVEEKKVN